MLFEEVRKQPTPNVCTIHRFANRVLIARTNLGLLTESSPVINILETH